MYLQFIIKCFLWNTLKLIIGYIVADYKNSTCKYFLHVQYINILYYTSILIVTNCKYIILFMLYYSCLWEYYRYKRYKRNDEVRL